MSLNRWIEKMWYIYNVEYYSAVLKNEMMKFPGKWVELEKNSPEVTQERQNCWVNDNQAIICRTTEVRYRVRDKGDRFLLGKGNRIVIDGWETWNRRIKCGWGRKRRMNKGGNMRREAKIKGHYEGNLKELTNNGGKKPQLKASWPIGSYGNPQNHRVLPTL